MKRPHMFDETSPDIPSGYGIEQHPHDGYYAYRIPGPDEGLAPLYLKDERGLDEVYATRQEALEALRKAVVEQGARCVLCQTYRLSKPPEASLQRCVQCEDLVCQDCSESITQLSQGGFLLGAGRICRDCADTAREAEPAHEEERR